MSSYLASLGVSEPYLTVLAFGGQGTGSEVPSSTLQDGRGGGSTLPTCVAEPSRLHWSSPVRASPFKWNVPLAMGARGCGEIPCSRKAFCFGDQGLWNSIQHSCKRHVREWVQGSHRGGPWEDKSLSTWSPRPLAWGQSKPADWKGKDRRNLCSSRQIPLSKENQGAAGPDWARNTTPRAQRLLCAPSLIWPCPSFPVLISGAHPTSSLPHNGAGEAEMTALMPTNFSKGQHVRQNWGVRREKRTSGTSSGLLIPQGIWLPQPTPWRSQHRTHVPRSCLPAWPRTLALTLVPPQYVGSS